MDDATCSTVDVCEDGCTGHDVGDAVRIKFHVRDPDSDPAGALTDATTSLSIKLPSGGVETPTFTSHPSVGEYVCAYAPTMPGQYFFRCVASGNVTAAETGAFLVRRSSLDPMA